MRLWTRLNHLVIANAHDAIDSMENPETMAKQALREMDDNIREARAESRRRLLAKQYDNRQLREELGASHAVLSER